MTVGLALTLSKSVNDSLYFFQVTCSSLVLLLEHAQKEIFTNILYANVDQHVLMVQKQVRRKKKCISEASLLTDRFNHHTSKHTFTVRGISQETV